MSEINNLKKICNMQDYVAIWSKKDYVADDVVVIWQLMWTLACR
jgi:hypothetical protein